MQSNKSSKERDGPEKDKQIVFFFLSFFLFYKTVFPEMGFLARDSERQSERERGRQGERDRGPLTLNTCQVLFK